MKVHFEKYNKLLVGSPRCLKNSEMQVQLVHHTLLCMLVPHPFAYY